MKIEAIEKRLLKYIPKDAVPYVTWLDHESYGRENTYFLTLADEDGRELSAEPADSVSELRFNAKQIWKLFQEGVRDDR